MTRIAALCTLVAALIAPPGASAAQAGCPGTPNALDAANAAFSRAWVEGDSATVIAAYTDNAVLHPPSGSVRVGIAEVRAFWGGIANRKAAGHRLETGLRRQLAPDVVLEVGRWHSRSIRDGETQPWSTGCYSVLWRRGSDGAWRMEFDTWTGVIESETACRPRE